VLVHLSQSTLDALDIMALDEGVPRLAVIRHALAEYTARHPAITRPRDLKAASENLSQIIGSG